MIACCLFANCFLAIVKFNANKMPEKRTNSRKRRRNRNKFVDFRVCVQSSRMRSRMLPFSILIVARSRSTQRTECLRPCSPSIFVLRSRFAVFFLLLSIDANAHYYLFFVRFILLSNCRTLSFSSFFLIFSLCSVSVPSLRNATTDNCAFGRKMRKHSFVFTHFCCFCVSIFSFCFAYYVIRYFVVHRQPKMQNTQRK